ncbi:MAG: ABC transporter ATP-binding protein [Candidatus Shapirobacteria bacterium]|jgi:ATP-binding cassette subfamily B protein
MKNIAKIIKISRPLYKILAFIVFLIITSVCLELAAPLVSKLIVDQIVTNKSSSDLIRLVVLMFGLNFLGISISAISERLGDHFAGQQRRLLTEKFYQKVLSLPQSYFDSEISGKIINQLSRGIFTIQGFTNAATNFIVPSFLQSILTIFLLARYSLPIAGLVFCLFPIYLALSYYSSLKWGQHEVGKNKLEDELRGRIQEVVANIKIVKGFLTQNSESHFVSQKLLQINKIYAVQSSSYHWIDFLRNASLVIVLLGINIVVYQQTFRGILTIGEMVLIIQLVLQARRPLFAMSFILTQLQNAESGSKEFFDILELPDRESYQASSSPKLTNPNLEFRQVSFNYQDSVNVLNKVSFTINSQEKIALVGPSGAGKTTITNLILKLYQPTSGEIFMSGKSYQKLSFAQIRQNIALVFQENELFSSTIKANVAYGTKATDAEIISALKSANAYDFVKKLPNGLNSQVGERGVKLSGGQKQRIQIARAILKNAPILILDEATSSLDAKSEAEVQEALEKLMAKKLVIIIAHRFSTLSHVDKVMVLDGGQIVQSGTPKELAKIKGIYSDLLNYQIEGNRRLLEGFELS